MNTTNSELMLKKIQDDLKEMTKDPEGFQFNRCLKRAKALRSPLQKGTVKDNFVRIIYKDVLQACCYKLNHFEIDQTNPLISSLVFDEARMIEVIYQYHLFHSGHLSDTMNIIDSYGEFICKANLLEKTEYSNFRKSLEMDANRLKENIEIIRKKFPIP